ATGGSPGRSARFRFHPGAREDARARTRRAVALLAASFAPDRFVVSLESGRGEALFHHIGTPRRTPDTQWLQ
ncbi:MAG TPA: hypothetical protein VHY20_13340, partial [Pirellulales bacterium]|nr:hypothetical protein [Pirellulales bacterium]